MYKLFEINARNITRKVIDHPEWSKYILSNIEKRSEREQSEQDIRLFDKRKRALPDFEIDHRISLYAAYLVRLDLPIVCCPINLEKILPETNRSKKEQCSVSILKFMKEYSEFTKSYPDYLKWFRTIRRPLIDL